MWISSSEADRFEAGTEQQRQLERVMQHLDANIMRLAMTLRTSLDAQEELSIAEGAAVPASFESDAATQRAGELRLQLQGLLSLRYSLVKHCADGAGVDATRQLVARAEAQMVERRAH